VYLDINEKNTLKWVLLRKPRRGLLEWAYLTQGRVKWLTSYEEGNEYDFGGHIKRDAPWRL
jgi:hypothetical protein